MAVVNIKKREDLVTVLICVAIVCICLGLLIHSVFFNKNNSKNSDNDYPTVVKYTADGYDVHDEENTVVTVGKSIPQAIKYYDTAQDAMDALEEASGNKRKFYLKHNLQNDIVEESFIEFVITDDDENDNQGIKSGTYSIKGGSDADYKENKKVMNEAFGKANCSSKNDIYHCAGAGLDVYAYKYGYIGVFDGEWYCDMQPDDTSVCEAGIYQGTF